MAGFDFGFTFPRGYGPYVEACLRASKSRARRLGCRWRTEWAEGSTVRRCVIDGRPARLDLLGRALELDLPTVCEGVGGSLPPSRARALGTGFANLYMVGRDTELGEEVQELRERKATTIYFPMFEAASASQSSRLSARLRVTEDVLLDFGLGLYPSEVVLEELHTALEQVLRERLGAGPGPGFAELRKRALACGLTSNNDQARWCDLVEHEHTDDDLLEDLRQIRNKAKHDEGESAAWCAEHWMCLGLLTARLGLASDQDPAAPLTPGSSPLPEAITLAWPRGSSWLDDCPSRTVVRADPPHRAVAGEQTRVADVDGL